ncbi:MAG: hypothetical protein ACFB4I_20355 [Cyanophyceae cyanobacterium]
MKRAALILLLTTWLVPSHPLQAQAATAKIASRASPLVTGPSTPRTKDQELRTTCPSDIQLLIDRLLQDLPGYANRVIQRAALFREPEMDVYVIVAGRPEFEPLTLGPEQYKDSAVDPNPPQQVFFTTLERQYLENRVVTVQNYHWLFLTQTSTGWRMALIYTRLGSPTESVSPRPPLETSDSIIGQAVKLWLRDCRAGALRRPS